MLQFLPHDVAHELEDMLAHDGGAANIKINYRWVQPLAKLSNSRLHVSQAGVWPN